VLLLLATSVVVVQAAATRAPRSIPDCAADCMLSATRVARIGGEDDTLVTGSPWQVAGDARGRLFVTFTRNAMPAPPTLVLDSSGRLLRALARRGRGPGESDRPEVLHIGPGDTIRLYEPGREIVFDGELRHIRTSAQARSVQIPRQVVRFHDDTFLMIGSELYGEDGLPQRLRRHDTKGTTLGELREVSPLGAFGPMRRIAHALEPARERLWIAQFAWDRGRGYDLLLLDRAPRLDLHLRRVPREWITAPQVINEMTGTSRVEAIREVAPGIVAVMIAHPKPNWRSIPIHPKRFTGWWNRYDTRVEFIDTRSLRVLGTASITGYPRAALPGDRFVTYQEDADGLPILDVWRVPRRW
jgi:hypothetical protein